MINKTQYLYVRSNKIFVLALECSISWSLDVLNDVSFVVVEALEVILIMDENIRPRPKFDCSVGRKWSTKW